MSGAPHCVRPRAGAHELAALVVRAGLEDVERHSAALAHVLDLRLRRDLVAGHHQRAPDELLTGVQQMCEVDLELGVEQRAGDRRGRVDHREHRRRDEVWMARLARRLEVMVQRMRLAHRARVLADLLPPHGVGHRGVDLAGGIDLHGHRCGLPFGLDGCAARMDKYLTSAIQVTEEDGDRTHMSRKLKALGALNLVGWTVAIPLLMVALVGPIVAFHGWPSALPGLHGDGQVRLAEPGERSVPARPDGRRGSGSPVLAAVLPGGVAVAAGSGIAAGAPAGSAPAIGARTRRGGAPTGALPSIPLPAAPVTPAPTPAPAPAPA